MTDRPTLALDRRELLGKKVSRLRRQGILPAVVYGKDVAAISVQLNAREFNDLYRRIGRTTLLDLRIDGRPPIAAFIHILQRHPVSRAITHVDFRAVDLRAEVVVSVPVHITGESPLAARGDAVLNLVHTTLDVRALPTDVPQAVNVDVSGLDSMEKTIHVRDITLTGKATIDLDGDELVASLTPARAGEEGAVEDAAAPSEPELVREKREEDE
jgi:large subunit ribosomal protein L25